MPVGVLVDRLLKPSSWYERYPKQPLSKKLAIVFAVFFPQGAWLYAYEENQKKFWFYTAAALCPPVPIGNSDILLLDIAAVSASLGFWAWIVVDIVGKDSTWYESYPDGVH